MRAPLTWHIVMLLYDANPLWMAPLGNVVRKGRQYRSGPRMVDVLERCFDGRGQVWPRTGNPPQLDNQVRISDCHNGGDSV